MNPHNPAARSAPLPEPALAALRGATRSRHDQVDVLMDLEQLAQPAHYARVLQVLAAFLGPWEPAVAAALPARADWLHERSRRRLLADDLATLRLPPLPPPAPMRLVSAAAAWGSLYVVEGSALGGQVIGRVLAERGRGTATRYFQGWGATTGARWREFRGLLASEVTSPAAIAQACEGARLTFETLSNLLETHLHERTAAA